MSEFTPIQAVDECIALLKAFRNTLTPTTDTINVKVGDNLQLAHDAAKPGDTLIVDPGIYEGLIITKEVNIVPNTAIFNGRVFKTDTGLIQLKSKDGFAEPLSVVGNNVSIVGVQPLPYNNNRTLVTLLGDNIVLDKCLILGDAKNGQRRGIAANGSNLTIRRSYIDDIFHVSDAQAICGWNGAGPFTIDNCYLSASGETVLFGGSDPEDFSRQPSHLTLTNSILTKSLNWITNPNAVVKNVLEFKNMVSAVVKDCTIENSWTSGQVGYLIVLTPRNQDGNAPYSQVAHVEIANCIIQNGGAGIQFLGADYSHPSMQTTDIRIINNTFKSIGRYTGDKKLFTFSGIPGCKAVTIDGNVCSNSTISSFLYLTEGKLEDFYFINNEVPEGEYGLMAADGTPGIKSWNQQVTSGAFKGNKIHAGGIRNIDYGPDNIVIP